MEHWRWSRRPAFAHLASSTTRPIVAELRRIFPEREFQIYTPMGAAEEHRVYYVTSNADAPPYEAWITVTAVRNHANAIRTLYASRDTTSDAGGAGGAPDVAVCRELIRDGIVVALDVRGDATDVRVESYALDTFPCSPPLYVAALTRV